MGEWKPSQHNTETQLEALRVCARVTTAESQGEIMTWSAPAHTSQRKPASAAHTLHHSPGWSGAVISKDVSLPLICSNSDLESLKGERTPLYVHSHMLHDMSGQCETKKSRGRRGPERRWRSKLTDQLKSSLYCPTSSDMSLCDTCHFIRLFTVGLSSGS